MEETKTESLGDTRDNCNHCNGTGTCDMCEGSGAKFSHYDDNGEAVFNWEESCTHCLEGKIGKCSYCMGSGKFDPAFSAYNPSSERLDSLNQYRTDTEYGVTTPER